MRVTLDQWRALVAVVDAGGYAAAAERLHKSQSTVSYAVARIEELLDVAVFEIQGRRAVLTPAGEALVRRARGLLESAEGIERGARQLAEGVEQSLTLAVDIVFPTWLLLTALETFGERYPDTRIELVESVLGGTDEALYSGQAAFAISSAIPRGFTGEALLTQRALPVAHPDHPLHRLGREVTLDDLRRHRQLVIRDTGLQRKRDTGGWLGADRRWTVSHKATSIRAVCQGLGFSWLAEELIRAELAAGQLKPLALQGGGVRHITLYLIPADPDFTGPAARHLMQVIRDTVAARATAD